MTSSILFHQLKHHLHYLRAWVGLNTGNLGNENIQTIKTIGNSQLDMYCGSLCVDEILQQVSDHLLLQGIAENGQYKAWVGSGYKLISLSDGSRFALRYVEHEKPVHIHPARHAPLTVRLKATALKTAACYALAYGAGTQVDIAALNKIRRQYLGLPPVAKDAGIAEINKAAHFFMHQKG